MIGDKLIATPSFMQDCQHSIFWACAEDSSQNLDDTKQRPEPARLLAKKVKAAKGKRGVQPKESDTPVNVPDITSRVPVSRQLLDSDNLAKVAAHCNERKTSAKACSVTLSPQEDTLGLCHQAMVNHCSRENML